MTYFVYLDEQEGNINGEPFTAVIGFRIRADDIIKVRDFFYPRLNEIIDKALAGGKGGNGTKIYLLPVLHGSDFLRDYTDDVKFSVLDAIVSSLEGIDFDLIRVGYFNKSATFLESSDSRRSIIGLSTVSVGFSIWDKPADYHVLVSEFDKEALRRSLDSEFSNLAMLHCIGKENVSINLSRFVGHYRATKSELGCQIADVVNYCCLKASNPTTEYSRRLAGYYDEFSDKYLVNQIIWLNDQSRSVKFPQKNSA